MLRHKSVRLLGAVMLIACLFLVSTTGRAEARAEMTRDELIQLIGDSTGLTTGTISIMLENTNFDDAAGKLGKTVKGAQIFLKALNGQPRDAMKELAYEVGKEVCLAILKKAGYAGVAGFISVIDTYNSLLKFVKDYFYVPYMKDWVINDYCKRRENGASKENAITETVTLTRGGWREYEMDEFGKYFQKKYYKDGGIYKFAIGQGQEREYDIKDPNQKLLIERFKKNYAHPEWMKQVKLKLEEEYQVRWFEKHRAELVKAGEEAIKKSREDLKKFFGRDWYFHFFGEIKGLPKDMLKYVTMSVTDSNGKIYPDYKKVDEWGAYNVVGPKLKELTGSKDKIMSFTFKIKLTPPDKPEKEWTFPVRLNGKRCRYYTLIDRIEYTQDFNVRYDEKPAELTGTVVDAEDGKPVSGAKVLVKVVTNRSAKYSKPGEPIAANPSSSATGLRMELPAPDGTFVVSDKLYAGQSVKVYATAKDYTVERTTITMQQQGNQVTLRIKKKTFDLQRSILFLVDCSGSMSSSNRIARAREAVVNAVNGLKEDTEVAVIAFSGCGSRPRVVAGFSACTEENKKSIITKAQSLSAGGATPLAEAIRYAKWYLNRNARSKNRNMITLSDGEETCQGKPTSEARALSK